MSRDDVIERVRRGRAELDRVLAGLTDEALSAAPPGGGWSVKDHLAHLSAWHEIVLARITGQAEHDLLGLARGEYESKDVDGINASIHERNRDRSAADVRAEFERSYGVIVGALASVDEDRLSRPWLPEDPSRGTLTDTVAANTYDHYVEHLPAIRAAVGRD